MYHQQYNLEFRILNLRMSGILFFVQLCHHVSRESSKCGRLLFSHRIQDSMGATVEQMWSIKFGHVCLSLPQSLTDFRFLI